MAHVLFVCLHNAGRSQISEALFERAADGRHTAASAGTIPADRVHREVIEVMHELAHADLAGVLAQDVDKLQADRVAERLGDLGHPHGLITLHVGIHDRLAAALAGGTLDLRGQFKFNSHA